MHIRRTSVAALLAMGVLASACEPDDEDTLGPNVASNVTAQAGNAQAGPLGDPLADSVTVFVANGRGSPVTGATVTWTVESGGGSVSPEVSATNEQGLARAKWTLGAGATGENRLSAAVDGVASAAVFTATANPLPFSANLTGAQVRPTAVTTSATGSALFSWDGSQLTYQVTVNGDLTSGVVGVHVHGPVADSTRLADVILELRPTTGLLTGRVATGTATAASGQTPVPEITIDSVVTLLRARAAYVDVHTENNPGGEIRGQAKSP